MAIALITISILFSIFVAVRPFYIGKLPVNMATAPLLALPGLLTFGVISLETLRFGIFGTGQLVPWKILVIFFTIAYVYGLKIMQETVLNM